MSSQSQESANQLRSPLIASTEERNRLEEQGKNESDSMLKVCLKSRYRPHRRHEVQQQAMA